jgi:hypothetical protein
VTILPRGPETGPRMSKCTRVLPSLVPPVAGVCARRPALSSQRRDVASAPMQLSVVEWGRACGQWIASAWARFGAAGSGA